jgi:hypothetical protein
VNRLFCQAGLKDIEVYPIIHAYPHGHGRRLIFWQFLQNVRDRILEQGLIAEPEFSECMAELKEHLDRSDTLAGCGKRDFEGRNRAELQATRT